MKFPCPLLSLFLFLGAANLFFCNEILAHEGRPVFVEVRSLQSESINNPNFTLRWKIPPVFTPGTEPHIGLRNPECLEVEGRQNQNVIQKLIGIRHYQCSISGEKLEVNIHYPSINPALSSLIVFYNQEGAGFPIFSGPDKTSILLNQELDTLAIASQYLWGGIKHILLGWDHLLFVLCLIILAGSFSRLLITITGFTLAHTVTLVASSLNMLSVPIQFIEVLIALSIVLIAAEIVRYKRSYQHGKNQERDKHTISLTRQYPFIAASLLGLLHGFGFASVLADLGLPENMKLTALLFFNLGIELGQIIFICGMLSLAYLLSKYKRVVQHQERIIVSSLYFVGITASYWVVERFVTLLLV